MTTKKPPAPFTRPAPSSTGAKKPEHIPLDCSKPQYAHLRASLYRRHAAGTLNTENSRS